MIESTSIQQSDRQQPEKQHEDIMDKIKKSGITNNASIN